MPKGTPRLRALQRAVEDRERELAILAEVSERLHGEEDVQAILDATLDAVLTGLGLETAWVFLGDEKAPKLRLAAHRGVSPAYLEARPGAGPRRVPLPGGPRARATGCRPATRPSARACRRSSRASTQPVAHACVPLASTGRAAAS